MFFTHWFDLARVLIVGVSAYAALVFLLRISGKRTLSKMNAFDLVVTVALGSTLATILLSKDVALAEGLLALALLGVAACSTHPKLETGEPLIERGGSGQGEMWRRDVGRAVQVPPTPIGDDWIVAPTEGPLYRLWAAPTLTRASGTVKLRSRAGSATATMNEFS